MYLSFTVDIIASAKRRAKVSFYVGATVQIKTEAIEKFVKRDRRYVRHRAEVYDLSDGEVKFRETRDILSL